ncbi:MAG: hypothetical protein ACN6OP_24115, partial [Pseudomonadales bacterium]
GQFISRDPVEGEARLPITWSAYQYGRYNPYRYTDPNGKFSTPGSMCSTPEECAGIGDVAIGIGRSLWKGVKDAAGLAWDLAQSSADAELAVYGDRDAQKRLDRSAEVLNQVVRNIPNLPSQAVQQQKVVSAQIEQLRRNGEDHAANRLMAENATDIAQWGAVGYGAGKSAIGFVNSRRIAVAAENTASRVVEAKTPSVVAEQAWPNVNESTPRLVTEKNRLAAGRELQPVVTTAQNLASEVEGSQRLSNKILRQNGGGGLSDPADAMYDLIRRSSDDVKAISANTGIKLVNINKVKDHVFYREHLLDMYVEYNIPARLQRFDSDLNQAMAWRRLESGEFTKNDITWLKHEMAERWYELRHNSGYNAAHRVAEKKWSGSPWD